MIERDRVRLIDELSVVSVWRWLSLAAVVDYNHSHEVEKVL